jgi:prepilin-type N-terminal cleavage/methylation domain-containing protein
MKHDRSQRDGGFTVMELIIAVTLLAIFVSAAVLAFTGLNTQASGTGCDADRRQLEAATQAFLAQSGGDRIPATGTGVDRFERTLTDLGLIQSPSRLHDLTGFGLVLAKEQTPC